MASLTCPNCGKDNPDFLDDCQFCQTPLRRESTLNIGEGPTKKSTGELEGVLPDWLKDARQQARDSAEEEAKKEAAKPRLQKDEPVDLLAGLAFQAASDEEDVPDWLAALNPAQDKKSPASFKPVEEDQPSDFFAQFEGLNQQSADLASAKPDETPEETLPWMSGSASEPQKDELTDWFSQTSASPGEPFTFDTGEMPAHQMDSFTAPGSHEPNTPKEAEDLSWLRDLEASTKQQPPTAAKPFDDKDWMSNLDSASGTQDDLSWLNNLGGTPAPTTPPEPQKEDLSWLDNTGGTASPTSQPESPQEDLNWLTNLGGTPLPDEPVVSASQPAASKEDDLGWLNNLGRSSFAAESEAPQSASTEDDLSWLKNMGGTPAPAEPAKEDLSWLNNFGEAPAEPASPQPASSAEDLSWLNNLGGTPVPESARPAQEDLNWLNNLTGTPPVESESPQPASSSSEDLSWLTDLGGTPAAAPSEPSASPADLDWLQNLGGIPETPSTEPTPFPQADVPDWLKDMEAQQSIESAQPPQFSPRHTAPLSESAQQEMPDWLKSATEASASDSMPPLGAAASDWFSAREQPAQKRKPDEVSGQPVRGQASDQTQPEPVADTPQGVPADQNIFSTPSESSLANQDVDALFAVDMPDWLSQPEPGAGEATALQEAASPTGPRDELAPVNLPSWVQAMRPVEAVISETSAVSADQKTEREGPLAGLRGVIPLAPIGSAQRPRALSLKLQATDEQQASASLVEQILAGESSAQPMKVSPFMSAQRALRWGLAGLFLLVLSAVIGLDRRFIPIIVSTPQMAEISSLSNTILGLPDRAPVLVVMDYEPSLAGEMEATSGPLLDQLVALRTPTLVFVSTSPNGTGLVDRLLANTKISSPAPDGLGYQAGSQYFNAGYLPGGLTGVRGFTEAPQTVLPTAGVNLFSEFAALILITDHAESGQVWIEQVTLAKQVGLETDPALAGQQFLVVASAQAGPMLRPYVSSRQVAGMVSGLPEAARYENMNNSRPGNVRPYWDAFGIGLVLAIGSIVIGSVWSLFAGIRARRAEAEPG